MLYEINNLETKVSYTGRRSAIVTMAVGDFHRNIWEKLFKSSWLRYAEKFDFDVFVIMVPLDESDKAQTVLFTWQKCLILEQKWTEPYERIIWIDSDIAISSSAPNIIESVVDPSKIGVCFENDQLSYAEKHIFLEKLLKTSIPPQQSEAAWIELMDKIKKSRGTDEKFNNMIGSEGINSGVMVVSPRYHKYLFRDVYKERRNVDGQEQPYLTYQINATRSLAKLSARFNWCMHPFILLHLDFYNTVTKKGAELLPDIIRNELNKSYFLHFNGSRGLLNHLMEAYPNPEKIFDE